MKRLITILWLFGATLVLGGCGGSEPPLRVGSNPWPGYLTLYYARELGRLDSHRVRLLDFDSSDEVMRAFRNRAIDAASLTLDEAILLTANHQHLHIVLVFDDSRGADVLLARPGIDSLSALRGKRLGVDANALGAYMLARALDRAGLSADDLTIVNLPPAEQEAAYRKGRVDALITFDPVRSRLLADGAHPLFSSRDIPGEIVDVLVVRDNALQHHADALQALVDAYFQALRRLRQHPLAAAKRVAPRVQMAPPALVKSWKLMRLPGRGDNARLLGGAGLHKTLTRMTELMRTNGLIESAPAQLPILDPRFVSGGGS